MIAQIPAARRTGDPMPAGATQGGESRTMKAGVRCVQVGLAIALIPALLVFVTVGAVGAGVTALVDRATRPGR